MTEIFFDSFVFLADVIKLSKDIPNIMLGEVLPLRGPLWEPKYNPKCQKYTIFNMFKNAAPGLDLQSDKMSHLVFIGQSDSELFSLPN